MVLDQAFYDYNCRSARSPSPSELSDAPRFDEDYTSPFQRNPWNNGPWMDYWRSNPRRQRSRSPSNRMEPTEPSLTSQDSRSGRLLPPRQSSPQTPTLTGPKKSEAFSTQQGSYQSTMRFGLPVPPPSPCSVTTGVCAPIAQPVTWSAPRMFMPPVSWPLIYYPGSSSSSRVIEPYGSPSTRNCASPSLPEDRASSS